MAMHPGTEAAPYPSRRWLMLAISLLALIVASSAQYGYAFLVPALREAGFGIQGAAGARRTCTSRREAD